MPLLNSTIIQLSALDPGLQRSTETATALTKLAEKLPNVICSDKCGMLDREIRLYTIDQAFTQLDADETSPDFRLDTDWWSKAINMKEPSTDQVKYPILGLLVKSLLSIFSGPLVESTFNIMDDIIECDQSRILHRNYEGIAIIKSHLKAKGETSLTMSQQMRNFVNSVKHLQQVFIKSKTYPTEKPQASSKLLSTPVSSSSHTTSSLSNIPVIKTSTVITNEVSSICTTAQASSTISTTQVSPVISTTLVSTISTAEAHKSTIGPSVTSMTKVPTAGPGSRKRNHPDEPNTTKEVQANMDKKNFDEAVRLRGKSFQNNLNTYRLLSKLRPPSSHIKLDSHAVQRRQSWKQDPKCFPFTDHRAHRNLAIMNIGAPACGMNAAVRSFVRISLTKGFRVLGIHDSFDGLIRNEVYPMTWTEVQGWAGKGGSFLGTKKQWAHDVGVGKIALKFAEFKLDGLMIVGGFEAFHSAYQLAEARESFPSLCIPIVVIPCTISNNIPGSDFSLGADTALNEITDICDRIKQSATGTKRRVFVAETMGGYCGYLATLAGLASGADAAYIYEERFNVMDLKQDVEHLKDKIQNAGVQRGLVLRNEMANENYTTDFINRLFSEEGSPVFTTRMNVLGHMQQGGYPSPFDRNYGTKMAAKGVEWLSEMVEKYTDEKGNVRTGNADTVVLLGMLRRHLTFTPVTELAEETDFDKRIPKEQWWLKLRPLLRILAKHSVVSYEVEAEIKANIDDDDDDEEGEHIL
ncbi:ATP-dependent 6-phosphofructokinase [Biomphalaria glabrata]